MHAGHIYRPVGQCPIDQSRREDAEEKRDAFHISKIDSDDRSSESSRSLRVVVITERL